MDKLPRAAKSCQELPRAGNLCFLSRVFRKDVRPRGLPLQGTIPSFSSMLLSRPGGAVFKAICWLKDVANSCRLQEAKRFGKQLPAAKMANSAKRCQELQFVFFTRVGALF